MVNGMHGDWWPFSCTPHAQRVPALCFAEAIWIVSGCSNTMTSNAVACWTLSCAFVRELLHCRQQAEMQAAGESVTCKVLRAVCHTAD
jgi:hypothetical protein